MEDRMGTEMNKNARYSIERTKGKPVVYIVDSQS